jgi:ABC-type nickel/cobalt efflux system permease component RcnA
MIFHPSARRALVLLIALVTSMNRELNAIPSTSDCNTKLEVSAWLDANVRDYKQKYMLSCEIALVRVSLAIAGIRNVSEDEILASIPKGTDPETAFVCDNINSGRRNKDGSIHWNNYGTHAPVVAKAINEYLVKRGKGESWNAKELDANDDRLRKLIADDPDFRGAVVWVVGHPERWGAHPPVNERGMVLGEHVRFVAPELSANGDFRIHDPENGKLIESPSAGVGRELFSYRIVGIFAKSERSGLIAPVGGETLAAGSDKKEKISRGAPYAHSRPGAMMSLGNVIKASISPNSDTRALALMSLLALAYGVLHALGPGHQKTLVSGYLLAEGGGPGAAIAAAGIASLTHAISVIGLFAVLMLMGSGFGLMGAASAGRLVTLASGILLVALAAIMVWRKTAHLVGTIRGKNEKTETCGCGHLHEGDGKHSHDCNGQQPKRGAIPLLISGSIAPCPGAALFLLYGFHEGNALAGVIAVASISLGMWITLIAVGLASVAVRSVGISGARQRKSLIAKYLAPTFGVCGSCAVLAIAILMVIPG